MILPIILLTPLVSLAILSFIPGREDKLIRLFANAASFAGLLVCIPAFLLFDRAQPNFGLQFRMPWIPTLGAEFYLGADGFSLLLIALTALLGWLAVLCSWNDIRVRQKEYYINLLLLQFASLGTFLALDFLLFFFFFELVLIPMYMVISIWGGPKRGYAATKFLIYTLAGSVLLLLAGIALHVEHTRQTGIPSFAIDRLLQTDLSADMSWWIFWGLFAGFAVKIPMIPFHTWLPDAHVEAPTAGSVLLAGVLLKMGTYGFYRFSLPLTATAVRDERIATAMGVLSMIAIVYGALVCLMQSDWKKLIAYSSVSHMGFCTLGLFTQNEPGITGSMLAQINHGISTPLLFLLFGYMYERRGRREIAQYGGLIKAMPKFVAIFTLASLSSMGLPPLNGFIGEFTVLRGAWQMSPVWAAAVGLGIILAAAYLLWLFQRVALGEPEIANATLPDVNHRELLIAAPLLFLIVGIGIYPKPVFDLLQPASFQVLRQLEPAKRAATLYSTK